MSNGCDSECRLRARRAQTWAEFAVRNLPDDLQAAEVAQQALRELERWQAAHACERPDRLSRAEVAMAVWHAGLAIAQAVAATTPAEA